MATLKARIQAFEQQQQVADGNNGDFVVAKKPEPRPRPRLQPAAAAKSAPPVVAPKPKNFSHATKPSSKGFWEDGGVSTSAPVAAATDSDGTEILKITESPPADSNLQPTDAAAPCAVKPAAASAPQPIRAAEKPALTPKPSVAAETPSTCSSAPSAASGPAPVPAPRPPPPKHPSISSSSSSSSSKPPPRPPVAPRAGVAAAPQEKSSSSGNNAPTLPPRPSMGGGGGGGGAPTETGSEETQDAENTNQTGECVCLDLSPILGFLLSNFQGLVVVKVVVNGKPASMLCY